jgi:hypothetical protein
MRLLLLPLALIPVLAGCGPAEPPPATDDPLPKELCQQAEKGLADLSAGGAIEANDKGEASIMEAAWERLKPEQRDQLVKLLAYRASCAAGAQSDAQTVVIRGDQGTDLARRTVSTRIDMRGAMKGLGEDVSR